MKFGRLLIALLLSLSLSVAYSQNETRQWYFGGYAALTFSSNPPSVLINSSMLANYSSASIADASGNLLFYTDGNTIWDKTHAAMANGTGLGGSLAGNAGSQNVIILKKPSTANIYYVIYTQWNTAWWSTGTTLLYSEVNMSLASGNGSVTVKGAVLANPTASITLNKLTATRHCNGTDIWLLCREWQYSPTLNTATITVNNSFRSYLISSTGINTTAVISTPITYTYTGNWGFTYDYGCMKVSPNGKKVAVALYGWWNNTTVGNGFELYDFNNSTGVLSNPLQLSNNTTFTNGYSWGVEFSPDGTKLYGSRLNGNNLGGVFQWNLCAGSPTAIAASVYTVVAANTLGGVFNFGALQLAPNGKIYSTRWNQTVLDVINNPNAAGAACGYSLAMQSISPKSSTYALPNFPSFYFLQLPPPPAFSYSASNAFGCQTATFNANLPPSLTFTNCASAYTIQSVQWNFGDPASGAANTSTLVNPSHAFTNLGTYTVSRILDYGCGYGTDTVKQIVNIVQPCISVTSTSITCSNLGSATVTNQGVGPFSYTWMPTNQTGSVATGLSPGTYTLTVYDFGNNFTYTATTTFNSLIPLTGNLSTTSSITCNGASTGTAGYTNLAGGSPNQNYFWTNGSTSFSAASVPSITTLSAGLWSATVVDALTGCTINDVFLIMQPPALTLNISASSPSTCAGTSVNLTGNASGGTAGYSYTWLGGPTAASQAVSQNSSGMVIYTLTAADTYSCPVSETVAVDYIPNPTVTLSNFSICPLQTATLQALGASSYTWNNNSQNSFVTASPPATTSYTVIGATAGCTAIASASIVIKPLPVPAFSSNNGVCNGLALTFAASGGTAFVWTGPQSFTSSLSSNTIAGASPANSGVYNLTLTGANSCTASVSYSLTVNPTPIVSASGGALCVNQSIGLTSSSSPAAAFVWTGPNGFSSTQQNPTINTPPVSASGNYVVKATTAAGCSNTAVANITVTALPVVNPQSNSPKCLGENVTFNANASGAANYNWTGPNNFNSSLSNPVLNNATLSDAGIYTLVVTNGPCQLTRTTSPVVIHALPNPSAISNGPVCEGKPVLFNASSVGAPIATYLWTGPMGFASQAMAPSIQASSPVTAGVYSLSVTDINNCKSATTLSLQVLSNPTVSTANATVCLNDKAVLKAFGAVSYQWTYLGSSLIGDAQLVVPKAQNPVESPAVYNVTGAAANGCTATASATVFTMKLPVPVASVGSSSIQCVGARFNLIGSGGLAYEWRGPAGVFATAQNFSFIASHISMAGVYTLTVFDAMGCKANTNVAIALDELPRASLVVPASQGCVPFCTELKFKPEMNSGSINNMSWVIGNTTYTTPSVSYCFNRPGTYSVSAMFSDEKGCAGKLTQLFHAWPRPVADFTFEPQFPIENFEPVNFLNTSSGDSLSQFSWYINDNIIFNSKLQNPTYLFQNMGSYAVALVSTNKWGCQDTVTKAVVVKEDFNVFVPNAFTPNGDGKNDVFAPVTRGLKEISFSVFSRWGQLLYASDSMAPQWNGEFDGQLCKPDTYIWKADVRSIKGEQKTLTGIVVLMN